MRETGPAGFKTKLMHRLKDVFPGCRLTMNNPTCLQGIPDITILYRGRYADLEVKGYKNAPHRPNQDYYVEQTLKQGGFACFVYPENEEEVIQKLVEYFNH